MAVYGVGAYYDEDVTKDFIDEKCFCIGYEKAMQQLYMKCYDVQK